MNIIHSSAQKFVPNPIFNQPVFLDEHEYHLQNDSQVNYPHSSADSSSTQPSSEDSSPFQDRTNLKAKTSSKQSVQKHAPTALTPQKVHIQSQNIQNHAQSNFQTCQDQNQNSKKLKHKKKISPKKNHLQQLYDELSENNNHDCIFVENHSSTDQNPKKNTQKSPQPTSKLTTHRHNDQKSVQENSQTQVQNQADSEENNTPEQNEQILKTNKFNFLNNQLNLDSSSDEEDQSQKSAKDGKGSSSSENEDCKIDFVMPKIGSRKQFFINKEDLNLDSSQEQNNQQNDEKAQKQIPHQTDDVQESQQDGAQKSPKTTSRAISVTDFRRQFVDSDEEYLKKPLPEGVTIDLIIKRDKSKRNSDFVEYALYDSKTLKMLVMVIKKSGVHEIMAKKNVEDPKAHPDVKYLTAKLESNFLGNQFNLKYIPKISHQPNKSLKPQEQQEIAATVCYETNILGLKGPRKMSIYIPQNEEVKYYGDKSLEYLHSKKWYNKIQKYVNKQAKWNNEVQSYVLNLKGKARLSSVKNFVIVKEPKEGENKNPAQQDASYVIFGKISKEIFNLSISGPFSIIQGLSLALSTFERKFICQ